MRLTHRRRRSTVFGSRSWFCRLSVAGIAIRLWAGNSETARVFDGSGGWATNATRQNLSAVCQPSPIGLTTNAGKVNWGGFLQTFVMFPTRDADGDGRPDENDSDDDNDGLADAAEIAGSAFVPITPTDILQADSDHDGANDGAEAAAGSDPWDDSSVFRIVEIAPVGGDVTVKWMAREGYRYNLLASGYAWGGASNAAVVEQVTASGGTGAWQRVEAAATDPASPTNRFYRVEVLGLP
jgi:hypothetical protein